MKKLYIVTWKDGSQSDPVEWKEALKIRRETRENLEEDVKSIDRYEPGDSNREYSIGYAHACGYRD